MNSRRALIFILLICVLGSGRAVYAQVDDAAASARVPRRSIRSPWTAPSGI